MPYDVLHSWQCRRCHVRHCLLEGGIDDSDVIVAVNDAIWELDLSGFSIVARVFKRLEGMDPVAIKEGRRLAFALKITRCEEQLLS